MLIFLSALGFALSCLAYLSTFTAWNAPNTVLVLHPGIILVFAPAVWRQRTLIPKGSRFSWGKLLRGCPGWMVTNLYLIFAFAMISFVITVAHEPLIEVRAFSGHWMIFYYASLCIHVSYRNVMRGAGR